MSRRSSLLLLGMAGLLPASLPTAAQQAHKAKPKDAPAEMATIVNTGSTNTSGYTVTLYREANVPKAIWVQMPESEGGVKTKDVALVKLGSKLFRDLGVAMPLSALPVRHGMRSVSFGTSTYITYKGQRSPDLTFASDARTVALKADINQIVKTLHIGNAPRRLIVIHLNSANTP